MGCSAEGFQVNTDSLRQLGQCLADLKVEFDHGVGGLDQLIGALGHQGLQDKVRQFGDNWSDQRTVLSGQLEQAAGFAKQAADVYQQTDEEMAKKVHANAAAMPVPPTSVAPSADKPPSFLQPLPPKVEEPIRGFPPITPKRPVKEVR